MLKKKKNCLRVNASYKNVTIKKLLTHDYYEWQVLLLKKFVMALSRLFFFFFGESYQDKSLLIIMEDLAFNEIISYYILYHNPIQLQFKYSMAYC